MSGDEDKLERAVREAHRHSRLHRDELLRSETCGCFYCLAIYRPAEIEQWIDPFNGVGRTAICPRCGVDAVLGSAAGFPLTRAFLSRMYDHWFAGC